MDRTTQSFVDFIHRLSIDQLNEECRDAVKRLVMDSLACAWLAVDAEPIVIARKALLQSTCPGVAHVVGGGTAPVDVAAFINSMMVRSFDYNDVFFPSSGHPSEMILPLFNVAEETGSNGSTTMVAIVAAYQVAAAISIGAQLFQKGGWDPTFAMGMGTAAGASVLMGLEPAAIAHAITLAVATTPPLFSRKTGGVVSMWKGGAGPQACRMGIVSALLARGGMTGPNRVFEGPGGVWQKYTGEFDVRPYLEGVDRYWVQKAGLKMFPVAGTLQAPIAAALELWRQIDDPDLIKEVEIVTNAHQIERLGGPEHWEVRTREAADHSLPYTVAATLRDGSLTPSSFDASALSRSDIRDLISRMSIKESQELTARFIEAKENVSEIIVRLSDGRTVRKQTDVDPSGHPNNPASRDMIQAKLSALIEPRLGAEKLERLATRVQSLETWPSMSEIFVVDEARSNS